MAKNQPKAADAAVSASTSAGNAGAPLAESDESDSGQTPGADPGDTESADQAQPGESTSALVQVDSHIGGVAYPAGVVIEGLPAALAAQYVGSVDPHPEAVAHAVAAGARVLQFNEA